MKLYLPNAARLGVVILLALSSSVFAAVPDGISYQAYLTNNEGAPIDTDVSITFAAYNVDVGGVPLWSATQLVSPDSGLFSVTLGNPANPFPAGLFDTPIFIGLFVAGEEMLPRRPLRSAGYAFKAADADSLTGFTAADLDQSAEIAGLTTDVNTIESIAQNAASGVANNAGEISANASNISSNSSGINSNDNRISVLEVNPGDITSVTAGAGLTGGGASGSVALAIGNGAINQNMLATGSVTSDAIADSTIQSTDLNSADSYTVNGLTTTGQLNINSGTDIIIRDNYNGLRWRTSDGSGSLASIEVREQDTIFRDASHNRIVFRSEENGIGIGSGITTAGYAVTMPSLNVTGTLNMGYERVQTSYDLSSTTPQCHSAGNLTCHYGIGSVVCPVGKKILGGGSSGSSGRYGSISIAAPFNDITFQCAASYDIAGVSRNCYAICARVE
ncbi:MAG: hypothetical protein AB8G18_07200 [Gammaproteobacteria bacterium]